MSLPNNREPMPALAHEIIVPIELLDHGPSDVRYWDRGPDERAGHTLVGGDVSALRADRAYHGALRRFATANALTEFQASELVRTGVQARRAHRLAELREGQILDGAADHE